MSSQVLRFRERADEHTHVHPLSIERQLERFRSDIRPCVSALATQHPWLAELSLSFPALLIALARPRARFDPAPVIANVIAGVPLASVAQAARVPLWLRGMRPELLPAPLPELPDSQLLRRCIVNHFPAKACRAPHWFESVSRGAQWATDDFALWCARHFSHRSGRPRWLRRRRLLGVSHLLCLWGWFSTHPGTHGHALIEKRWISDMGYEAAIDAALQWREVLDAALNLARGVADIWARPGNASGYEFIPLRDPADVVEEARMMKNCVCTYADDVAHGWSRLWSVRKDGVRVATLEVARRGNDPLPYIGQMKLAGNAEPPAEVWLAAHCWLRAQVPMHFSNPLRDGRGAVLDAAVWTRLWKPYWLTKGCVPTWLPLAPSRDAWGSL